ncbi:hypothetical protein TSUD_145770 [Trifolium subterraneum]|uniref:SKI-interacting protein SKIP SNW domain-containing protein n=1 Tax=Trifolium subterraneum TaxID=3900 RepID=A0A2Z6MSI9_TRISU|nr:hypothetical protein TSUD_145770 [Trifolium subterraneum]
MAALMELLPEPKSSTTAYYDHSNDPWFKQRFTIHHNGRGKICCCKAKIGTTYPLDMGRNKSTKLGLSILPVTDDVHDSEMDDVDDDEAQQEIDETMQETKAALKKIVNVRLSAAQPKNVPKHNSDSKYIKYKPSQQNETFNSGARERVIRMVQMSVDSLEPPKFKHKRVPKASGSPPVPLMHSPPRSVTVKDQQDWKIPPCISNWKNPKGYTIPLDKRLAADGRGLQEKGILLKEKERKEQELRALAQKARSERIGVVPPPAAVPVVSERSGVDDGDMRVEYEHRDRDRDRDREREKNYPKESREEREEWLQREKIREESRKDREKKRRLEAKDASMGKKSKITRDRDRDISEKVALGLASTKQGLEVMHDERLFNQDKGMSSSGYAADDQYNIYDKGLLTAQPTLSTLYRPKKDADNEVYGGADEQLEKIMKTDRFKPDKGFTGASERAAPRDRPVEFESEEADPFGLDQFLTEVKKGKKAFDNVGGGGTMRASAGSSMRDSSDGGSGRTHVGFERGR